MVRKSVAEINKLLKETAKMNNNDAAKHMGISLPTLYKWKAKAKSTVAKASTKEKAPKAKVAAMPNKKVINLVKAIKEKIAKLEKELA